MPDAVRANTNVTTMMIAERAAEFVRDGRWAAAGNAYLSTEPLALKTVKPGAIVPQELPLRLVRERHL